jgi:hypothetical protein
MASHGQPLRKSDFAAAMAMASHGHPLRKSNLDFATAAATAATLRKSDFAAAMATAGCGHPPTQSDFAAAAATASHAPPPKKIRFCYRRGHGQPWPTPEKNTDRQKLTVKRWFAFEQKQMACIWIDTWVVMLQIRSAPMHPCCPCRSVGRTLHGGQFGGRAVLGSRIAVQIKSFDHRSA